METLISSLTGRSARLIKVKRRWSQHRPRSLPLQLSDCILAKSCVLGSRSSRITTSTPIPSRRDGSRVSLNVQYSPQRTNSSVLSPYSDEDLSDIPRPLTMCLCSLPRKNCNFPLIALRNFTARSLTFLIRRSSTKSFISAAS